MRSPRRDNTFASQPRVTRQAGPAHPRNALQRRHGNRRAQQIIQARLDIGSAAGSPPRGALETMLQAYGVIAGAADPAVAQAVARALARSDGQPVPSGVQGWLEQVPEADLSGVRVQVDYAELQELLALILQPPEPEKQPEPDGQSAGDFFDDVERRISADEEVTDDQLDTAVMDLIAYLVEGQGYVDGDGNTITSKSVINLTWGEDYQVIFGTLELPDRAVVRRDIASGYFRTAVSHEMGHYVRRVGGGGAQDDAVYSLIETEVRNIKFKQASYYGLNSLSDEYWREELSADLKGIWLQYRRTGRLPDVSEIDMGLDQLGGANETHPPAGLRVALMKKFVRGVKKQKDQEK